jgi:HK97 family phage prohead protease
MELHQKKLNLNISTKQFNISDEQDVVTIEGYASKMYQDGNPVTDLDQEMVSTANFRLEAKRLLLFHDLSDPVGDITLEHRPDGIYLKGKVYKDTMKDQDWARLKRGLFDFSIGFIAEEAEYRNIDGKEILVFTKGVIYEVSLVAIPSNKFATLDVIKSIQSKSGLVMECTIDSIKSMNPDMDCSCLNGLKEDAKQKQIERENMDIEKIKEAIKKGLTIEETMNESWNISDDLFQMFNYFIQTLEDNIYEFKWSESFDRTEMLANINQAMDIFRQTVEDESLKIGQAIGKKLEGKNMITKEINTEGTTEVTPTEATPTEAPAGQSTEETPKVVETVETTTEVIPTETPKEETKEEVKTEVTEQSQEQNISTDAPAEVSSDVKNNDEKSETNELANTLDFKQETIDILTADLEQLDVDKIRVLYDTLSDKLEKVGALQAIQALQKIEQYVENELQNQE